MIAMENCGCCYNVYSKNFTLLCVLKNQMKLVFIWLAAIKLLSFILLKRGKSGYM